MNFESNLWAQEMLAVAQSGERGGKNFVAGLLKNLSHPNPTPPALKCAVDQEKFHQDHPSEVNRNRISAMFHQFQTK
jgi:hypothetical protein